MPHKYHNYQTFLFLSFKIELTVSFLFRFKTITNTLVSDKICLNKNGAIEHLYKTGVSKTLEIFSSSLFNFLKLIFLNPPLLAHDDFFQN